MYIVGWPKISSCNQELLGPWDGILAVASVWLIVTSCQLNLHSYSGCLQILDKETSLGVLVIRSDKIGGENGLKLDVPRV